MNTESQTAISNLINDAFSGTGQSDDAICEIHQYAADNGIVMTGDMAEAFESVVAAIQDTNNAVTALQEAFNL